MSAAGTDWKTPPWLLELVRKVGPIGLDPATDDSNPTEAKLFCTPAGLYCREVSGQTLKKSDEDGLTASWSYDELVYVNPPYSRDESPRWAAKLSAEARAGVEIIALLPARVDTVWFHEHVFTQAQALCFLKGRPRFSGSDGAGKFPSVVAYYGDRARAFKRAFEAKGWCVS